MDKFSLSFSIDQLVGWLRANGIDEDDCSKIRAAKFRGESFILLEKEEHFKEMGIPVGSRLFLERLVKKAKMEASANTVPSQNQDISDSQYTVGLTASNLSRELEELVDWKKLAVALNIPLNEVDKITRNNPLNVDGQKLALFGYIERNYRRLGITWSTICEALQDSDGNLALQLREKYCNKEHIQANASAGLSEDPNRLGLRHLQPIMTAVYDVRCKWRYFGLELDILAPELDSIDTRGRGVPEDCLRMVLESWLRRETPKPTFREVLDALRSLQVNYGAIAGTIERSSEDKKSKMGFYY